eukprot:CAMPEP_0194327028 /NCGR_PEP_ID=MMETSP0171-20130528/39376_1 /TAXON_ID=218684 /ORGANISM="Corethron pennatum, Strain L29A3" /LENGTH=569 /DNA_ID=CAMNT_0039086823 /DNA_START=163 /DNA_END=1869 /DNA_ORIENTATION=-
MSPSSKNIPRRRSSRISAATEGVPSRLEDPVTSRRGGRSAPRDARNVLRCEEDPETLESLPSDLVPFTSGRATNTTSGEGNIPLSRMVTVEDERGMNRCFEDVMGSDHFVSINNVIGSKARKKDYYPTNKAAERRPVEILPAVGGCSSDEEEEGTDSESRIKGTGLDVRTCNVQPISQRQGRSKTERRSRGNEDVAILTSNRNNVDRLRKKRNRKMKCPSSRNDRGEIGVTADEILIPLPKRRGKIRRLDETDDARKKQVSRLKANCVRPRPDDIPDLDVKSFPAQDSMSCTAFLSSYGPDYYAGLFDTEQRYSLKDGGVGSGTDIGYMNRQPYLTLPMRGILVDWLIELTEEYKLLPETLYLAVKLVDRTLGKLKIERQKLQCVGCAAMLIAAKMEEIHPPTADDFVYISDSTYTKLEITGMELKICLSHSFCLRSVTPYHFIGRFLSASDLDCSRHHEIMEKMASYLLEISLLHYPFVEAKSSLVAAASIFLARLNLGIRDRNGCIWSKALEYYSRQSVTDLEEAVLELHQVQHDAENSTLKSVFLKYKSKKFAHVSCKTVLRVEDV